MKEIELKAKSGIGGYIFGAIITYSLSQFNNPLALLFLFLFFLMDTKIIIIGGIKNVRKTKNHKS